MTIIIAALTSVTIVMAGLTVTRTILKGTLGTAIETLMVVFYSKRATRCAIHERVRIAACATQLMAN